MNSSKNSQTVFHKAFLAAFVIVATLFIAFVVALNARMTHERDHRVRDFSEGWTDSDGNTFSITDQRVTSTGSSPIMSKRLPYGLSDDDCFCFESTNVNVFLFVDGQEIYAFVSQDNISGLGYGTAFHEVGLSKDMSGRMLTVRFESSNLRHKRLRGHMDNVYLCPTISYMNEIVKQNSLPFVASCLVIFFGIVFIMISFVISSDERLPFDIAALGISSVITGTWFLLVTNTIQLLTGHIYTVRVLNRLLVLLVGFPLICFINSLTKIKRRIYPIIEFCAVVFFEALIIILRYAFDLDMMKTFATIILVYFAQFMILVVIMLMDNRVYCRSRGISTGLRTYAIGIALFLICVFSDYAVYRASAMFGNAYGNLSSIGALILLAVVLMQFIGWWTMDKAVIAKSRFTNRALSYALSSDLPEESIRLMLEYICNELSAERVLVLEDMKNGKYHSTYSWIGGAGGGRSADLIYLPVEGVIDEVLRSYSANENRFVINDVEEYRNVNRSVYTILSNNNVRNAVAAPLEENGNPIGLLILADIPPKMLDEVSNSASLLSYFLSQLILRRDEQKRAKFINYNDPVSGAYNRGAYSEFITSGLDMSAPFGYVLCRIEDLESTNDDEGFESADRLVKTTVRVMGEVFGRENVYRVVGSKFAAFGFEADEAFFRDDVQRFLRQIREKDIRVSVGSAYCANGTKDMRTVYKYTNDQIV